MSLLTDLGGTLINTFAPGGGTLFTGVVDTVFGGGGGGGSVCPGQASVQEVQHMLATLDAAEFKWLVDAHARTGNQWKNAATPAQTDPAWLASAAAGGSDCKVSTTAGKYFQEAFNTMLARSRSRPAPGMVTGGTTAPPTTAPAAPTAPYITPTAPTTQPSSPAGTYAGGPGTYIPPGTTPMQPPPAAGSGTQPRQNAGDPWVSVGFGLGIPPWVWLGLAVAAVFAISAFRKGGK